jgi:YVTN family beta-propeller protein
MFAPGKFQAAAWTGLLGLLLATIGCSDSNDPGGGGDLVSQEIGPAGGTVRSSDGELTLIFPAGAVTQTQTITIEPLEASELGSEFAAFTVERAYRLGPDGLAFQQPVTASVPSPAPVDQPDGSFTVNMGELLTSVGGQAQGLGNMRVEQVDGAVLLRGEMSHFSPIVQTLPGVAAMTVTGVPTTAAVGVPFVVQVTLVELTVQLLDPSYLDESEAPVRPRFSDGHHPLNPAGEDRYTGSFEYVCDAVGQGKYQGFVGFTPATEPNNRRGFQNFNRQVLCTEAPARTLTVVKSGDGTGTVTSNPAGITCGTGTEACTEGYAAGTAVALTATPDAGSVFGGWSGACPGGSPLTTVVMDADKTCNAQFDRDPNAILIPLGFIDVERLPSALAANRVGDGYLALVLGDRADLYDISNPAEPVLQPGGIDPWCPEPHSAFFFNAPGATNPLFLALRKSPPSACFGEVPLVAPAIAPLAAPPGEGAAIPGSNNFVFSLDHPDGAALVLVEASEEPPPPEVIRLTTGRGCPDGVAATASKIYVVLTAGPDGTIDAECSVNGRKLAIIDLATRQPTFVPLDGDPRDVTLAPDGSAAYVTDRSAGGFVWTFDPQLGVATRRLSQSFGPAFEIVAPDSRSLLVANGTSNTVHALDVATGTEITNVPSGGQGPLDIIMVPDGRTVIVPHPDGVINFIEYAR